MNTLIHLHTHTDTDTISYASCEIVFDQDKKIIFFNVVGELPVPIYQLTDRSLRLLISKWLY